MLGDSSDMQLEFAGGAIREWRATDAPSLARFANNPAVARQLRDAFPHPYRLRDAARFIAYAASSHPPSAFAIEVDGTAVGGIGISRLTDIERVSAEIGYWLGEPFWGRGLMTGAVDAVTAWAFETLAIHRIFAVPFAANAASCRVLEKSGYRLEGRLRRSALKDGVVQDQVLYAITDLEHAERRSRPAPEPVKTA
jgi:RimJ/RimL family protein N-acetyltransferase